MMAFWGLRLSCQCVLRAGRIREARLVSGKYYMNATGEYNVVAAVRRGRTALVRTEALRYDSNLWVGAAFDDDLNVIVGESELNVGIGVVGRLEKRIQRVGIDVVLQRREFDRITIRDLGDRFDNGETRRNRSCSAFGRSERFGTGVFVREMSVCHGYQLP